MCGALSRVARAAWEKPLAAWLFAHYVTLHQMTAAAYVRVAQTTRDPRVRARGPQKAPREPTLAVSHFR